MAVTKTPTLQPLKYEWQFPLTCTHFVVVVTGLDRLQLAGAQPLALGAVAGNRSAAVERHCRCSEVLAVVGGGDVLWRVCWFWFCWGGCGHRGVRLVCACAWSSLLDHVSVCVCTRRAASVVVGVSRIFTHEFYAHTGHTHTHTRTARTDGYIK